MVRTKIKILHIITGLNTGGAERALYNLLSSDFRSKYECSVISLTDEGSYGVKLRDLGVPLHALNIRVGVSIFRSLIVLRGIIKQIDPDILQGWMYHGNLIASLARRFCGDEAAVGWNIRHSLYDLSSEKFMTRQVIKASRLMSGTADLIFYNSNVSRLQHEKYGFEPSRSTVNPNGFDTELLQPSVETARGVRRAIGISSDSNVVGHVARYHPMKDHAGFITAMITVLSKRADLVVLVIGRDVRANIEFLLDDQSESLKSRFYFLGERHDIYDLMQSMDILCLSSVWGEGFPNVLGEAMSLAVPCITTDVADSAEVVGDTGLVVPPGKPDKLADAVLYLLNLSKAERAGKGRAARKRIETKYVIRRNTDRYDKAYTRLYNYRKKRGIPLDIGRS